ncbi:HNH endonuclease signature motif containing protein [Gordonia hankookensis]|uniref:HNH endonuclease n=1 Tax=Gordonia hankookensis TaxID=589403 RepID=A0ABR7WHA1_9ACTN|nr:HNH endonuclease signature motif containing protein [Gordonia hankookensis]MBD1322143.1 HNH endonuclease [Gordonia hankookensis]
MFSYTDPIGDDAVLSSLGSSGIGEPARDALRLSRQAEARALLMAHRIGEAAYDDMLVFLSPGRQMMVRKHAEKAAVGEISLQLGLSRTKAGTWYQLGIALQQFPKIRMAYLAGDLSTHRMSVLIHAAEAASDIAPGAPTEPEAPDVDSPDVDSPETDTPETDFEDIALDLAERPTTDTVLRDALEELVISLDPDDATEAREEFGRAWENVAISNDSSGHINIDACVPAEFGVYLRDRIAALIAARICRRDPRTLGQQRVVAMAALMGTPGADLVCQCGDENCHPNGERDTTQPPNGAPAVPLTQPDRQADERDRADTEPTSDTALTPAAPWTLVLDPAGTAVPRLHGYGAIDPAHAEHLHDRSIEILLRNNVERGPWGRLVVTDRAAAPPVDPTGHGGHALPPPGALTYTPSRRLRDEIQQSDLTCRYPWCSRPAHECDLDHLVKFDHADPLVGGWTLPENIAPLCRPDHQRKHLALWLPTMHLDRSITWTNPTTGRQLTTYPR